MRRKSYGALIGALVLLAGLCGAQAASRGLSVDIRASEARGAPATEKVELYGASHALVIGNGAYGGAWPKRSNAVKDARLVAEALRAKGFAVTLKTDLKSAALIEALGWFFHATGADPDARLFLWYGGHGYSKGGEGYLVPVDAPDPSKGWTFLRKALSLRRIGAFMRGAKALHILSVFDSNFEATIFNTERVKPPPAITRATTRPVRQFLTSGDAGQRVSDDGRFAKLFIRAINGETRADANRDGYLAASELGRFMTDHFTTYSKGGQTPRAGMLNDAKWNLGDFIFRLPSTDTVRVTAPPPSSGGWTPEMLFWHSVKDSRDADDFQAYLSKFPDGLFADLARLRRNKHKTGKSTVPPRVAAMTPPKIATPSPTTPVVGAYPNRRKSDNEFQDCPDCPEMVVIPSGRFRMGDLNGGGDEDEKPVHAVRIDYRFAVGKYAVTRGEYAAFANATNRGSGDGCLYFTGSEWTKDKSRTWRDPGFSQTDRDPVACVNWEDAKQYVTWLGRKTGQSYRLLSESEWEYAARAGSESKYSYGDSESELCAHGNGADRSTIFKRQNKSCDDGYGKRTAPVGRFQSNDFGLYDMHGNVWEWVSDCWHESYQGSPTDGSSWVSSGECGKRVLRGGAWGSIPTYLRAANRGGITATDRDYSIGFRVARAYSR